MRIVFHVNELQNYKKSLANIENILKFEVEDVILLINGNAIKLFTNRTLDPRITDPRFSIFACKNSMVAHDISEKELFSNAIPVPSGVYSLAQLQKSGYSYIKP